MASNKEALTLIKAAAERSNTALRDEIKKLKLQAVEAERRLDGYKNALDQATAVKDAPRRAIAPVQATKASKHKIRVIVPDSHGEHIDRVAEKAFLSDLKALSPESIVMLGDHLDAGGTFNAHQVTYTNELTESYEADCAAANLFLDAVRRCAPNATIDYLEGNHEAHVERWSARNVKTRRDAEFILERIGPEAVLKLKHREIRYYKSKEFHMGLAVRGSIKLGKCFFTHGISHSKHADAAHLAAFNGNIVFGHVHRAMEVRSRTVTSSGHGAWCPGTLAKLQPLYRHTEPTTWVHGYAIQFYNENSGRFAHWNVPIFGDGTTGLAEAIGAFRGR